MQATGQPGEIRLYGTPAEEGGAGKVYMVREGLFDDVDVVLHWHPSDSNSADARSSLANKSAKFRFSGLSPHAAAGGTSIGNKGMIVAAKTLAMTAADLFTTTELIESSKAEHEQRIPEGWEYEPLLGDRDPPLDYRLPAGPN